jgi:hypothetical protein
MRPRVFLFRLVERDFRLLTGPRSISRPPTVAPPSLDALTVGQSRRDNIVRISLRHRQSPLAHDFHNLGSGDRPTNTVRPIKHNLLSGFHHRGPSWCSRPLSNLQARPVHNAAAPHIFVGPRRLNQRDQALALRIDCGKAALHFLKIEHRHRRPLLRVAQALIQVAKLVKRGIGLCSLCVPLELGISWG